MVLKEVVLSNLMEKIMKSGQEMHFCSCQSWPQDPWE